MAKVLLISNKDLVKFTALNGNIDPDKVMHFIQISQDIYIQQYLGSKLLTKLLTDTANGTLTTDYSNLIDIYLKPMLIHFSAVELYPFIAYSISNKGVYKHSAENSEVVSKNEVDYLLQKAMNNADYYATRMQNYLISYSNQIHQYYQSVGNQTQIYPDMGNAYFGGINL